MLFGMPPLDRPVHQGGPTTSDSDCRAPSSLRAYAAVGARPGRATCSVTRWADSVLENPMLAPSQFPGFPINEAEAEAMLGGLGGGSSQAPGG